VSPAARVARCTIKYHPSRTRRMPVGYSCRRDAATRFSAWPERAPTSPPAPRAISDALANELTAREKTDPHNATDQAWRATSVEGFGACRNSADRSARSPWCSALPRSQLAEGTPRRCGSALLATSVQLRSARSMLLSLRERLLTNAEQIDFHGVQELSLALCGCCVLHFRRTHFQSVTLGS
jgi:hypothetical protein